jgi:hypothetical protein
LEAWALPLTDATRVAKPIAMSPLQVGSDPFDVHVTWDGSSFARSWSETGWSVSLGPNAAGTYCRVNSPPGMLDGHRVGDVNVALMRFLDAEVGTDFGEVTSPPDVRR